MNVSMILSEYCLANIGIVHQNIQQKTFPDLSAIQTFRYGPLQSRRKL